MDTKDLLPGLDWMDEVERSIKESRYFLALLSKNSVSKKGVVQKELKRALQRLEEHPPSTIYLLPVRIDNCEPLYSELGELHWLDLFPSYSEALRKLIRILVRDVENLQPEASLGLSSLRSIDILSIQRWDPTIPESRRRVQLDLSPEKLEEVKTLMSKVDISYGEVFNYALALLTWAAREVESGRVVGSLDEFEDTYKVLEVPMFRTLVKKANRRGPP